VQCLWAVEPFLLSRAGLVNHLKSHNQRNQAFYEDALPARPPMHSCPTCGLVCKSAGGLTRHTKIHKDVPQPAAPAKEGKFKCHICERSCKTGAGLKSHMRAHGRVEHRRLECDVLKCALRKQDERDVPVDVQEELKFDVCGRFLLSRTGLVDHLKSHNRRSNHAFYEDTLPARPSIHSCPTCGLVCKSAGGLTRHTKIHKDVPQPAVPAREGKFKCYICERSCKTGAGLKSHLRAHGRAAIT
jgi:hypothetical protein